MTPSSTSEPAVSASAASSRSEFSASSAVPSVQTPASTTRSSRSWRYSTSVMSSSSVDRPWTRRREWRAASSSWSPSAAVWPSPPSARASARPASAEVRSGVPASASPAVSASARPGVSARPCAAERRASSAARMRSITAWISSSEPPAGVGFFSSVMVSSGAPRSGVPMSVQGSGWGGRDTGVRRSGVRRQERHGRPQGRPRKPCRGGRCSPWGVSCSRRRDPGARGCGPERDAERSMAAGAVARRAAAIRRTAGTCRPF